MKRKTNKKSKTFKTSKTSENHYKSMFKHAPYPYQSLNNEGKLIEVNKAWLKVLGYKEKEVVGKSFISFLIKEHKPFFRKNFPKFKKEGCIGHMALGLKKKNGNTIYVEYDGNAKHDKNGKFIQTYCIFRDITARKKMESEIKEKEEKAKESEKRFKDIVFSSADWIWEVNNKGQYTFVSGKIKENLGYKPEELIGKTPFDLMPKEEAKRVGLIFKKIIAKKEPIVDLENWNLHKNGKKILLLTNGVPVLDKNGSLIGYRGVDKDITDLKKAEEQIKEAELNFRALFESSKDAMMTLAPPSWKFTSGNSTIVKMFDVKDEKEFTSLGPWNVSPKYQPDGQLSSAKAKKMIMKAMKTGSNYFEWTHKKLHGEDFYATVLLTKVDLGKGNVFLQATVRNITEQKEAALQIEKAKEKAEKYLDIAGTMIIVLDKKANISLLNRKGYEVLGYKEGELIGVNWIDTFIPKGGKTEIRKVFNALMSGKGQLVEQYENLIIVKGGGERMIRWNNTLVRDKNRKTIGIMSSGEDITETRKFEEIKNEFVSFVSHQLKGPIGSTNFGIEFLLMETIGPVNTKQEEYLKDMYKKNQRMIELIDMFLNITKIEMGLIDIQAESMSINKEINRVINEFLPKINEKLINITTDLDKKIGKIVMDKNLLQIVIRNLVANSVKYSKQNGRITIKTKKHSDHVLLTVKDSGIGIPKSQQKEVFNKMFRADNVGANKAKGSGLGLYITKKIIEGIEGKIWCKSVKDKGTTFFIKIPLKKINEKKLARELFK